MYQVCRSVSTTFFPWGLRCILSLFKKVGATLLHSFCQDQKEPPSIPPFIVSSGSQGYYLPIARISEHSTWSSKGGGKKWFLPLDQSDCPFSNSKCPHRCPSLPVQGSANRSRSHTFLIHMGIVGISLFLSRRMVIGRYKIHPITYIHYIHYVYYVHCIHALYVLICPRV
jgi:hypothetical protein